MQKTAEKEEKNRERERERERGRERERAREKEREREREGERERENMRERVYKTSGEKECILSILSIPPAEKFVLPWGKRYTSASAYEVSFGLMDYHGLSWTPLMSLQLTLAEMIDELDEYSLSCWNRTKKIIMSYHVFRCFQLSNSSGSSYFSRCFAASETLFLSPRLVSLQKSWLNWCSVCKSPYRPSRYGILK